jgi:hypothetical protein
MEAATHPTTGPRIQTSKGEEFQMSAVYVDDFLLAAVQNTKQTLLQRTMRATLHAIHSVFQPPSASDPPGTKDPISKKKLLKGNARWDPVKEVLGYELNGRDRTVRVPVAKAEALLKQRAAKDSSQTKGASQTLSIPRRVAPTRGADSPVDNGILYTNE